MVTIENPSKFADRYKLKSSRLKNFDYSSSGLYFITLCTYHHHNFFGRIINSKMELSKVGLIVNQCLINISKHFPNITLDEYIVMPNHVHILFHVETPYMASQINTQFNNTRPINKTMNSITNQSSIKANNPNQNKHNLRETPYMASLQTNSKVKIINYSHKNHPDFYKRLNQKSKQLIPKIIQQFKSTVTRQINPKTIFFAWQPRYHDIIIKDQKQYFTIKNYLKNNVINWERDKYFSR